MEGFTEYLIDETNKAEFNLENSNSKLKMNLKNRNIFLLKILLVCIKNKIYFCFVNFDNKFFKYKSKFKPKPKKLWFSIFKNI